MKKILAIFLVMTVLFTLCSCGGKPAKLSNPYPGEYSVGYAKADITPTESVPMGGYYDSSDRMSTMIQHNLYATCMAYTDTTGNTVLFFSTDLMHAAQVLMNDVRTQIAKTTGVPAEQIFINATMNHGSPDVANPKEESIRTYNAFVTAQMVQAAKDALADRSVPAGIWAGTIQTEKVTFVQQYLYEDSDGNIRYFGSSKGTTVRDSTTRHTSDADETMRVMKISRSGKKDLVIVHCQIRPCMANSPQMTSINADFISTFRTAMEVMANCDFLFLQGAIGNLASVSAIPGEQRNQDIEEFGMVLANYALECLDKHMSPLEPGPIRVRTVKLTCTVEHSTDHLVTDAQAVQNALDQTKIPGTALRQDTSGKISTVFHAKSILTRASMGQTDTLTVSAVTIGDSLALVTAPLNLYDLTAKEIAKTSPFPATLTLSLTNGFNGVLPTREAYELEWHDADITYYAKGTEEALRAAWLDMLTQMKE